MGVRGLTTFVEKDKILFEECYIHDCKLVIDGHSLMFWLSGHNVHPDSRVNQEYSSYGVAVRCFFNGLRQCGVEPLVVFDGPATEEKYDKVLRTLTGNVEAIEGMFHSDDEELIAKRLLPPFSLDAIMQLMVDLKVPFASSLTDADSEVVALANFLKCPLLGEDSDYYIFNVEYGYIRLRGFPGYAKKGERKLRCNKFSSRRFCRKYQVTQDKLPFLSVLLGNDWVTSDVFSDKRYDICRYFKLSWMTRAALKWLSHRVSKSDKAILEELYASLPSSYEKNEIENIISQIEYSVTLYRDLPDISELYAALCPRSSLKRVASYEQKPIGVEEAIRWCYVHFSAYHLVEFGFVGLPSAIVCDTHKQSPHLCALEIREFAYSHLLRRFSLASEPFKKLVIGEYDFKGASYAKVRGINIDTSKCLFCEQIHAFHERCKFQNGDVGQLRIGSIVSKFLSTEFEHSFENFNRKQGKIILQDQTPSLRRRLDVVMLATFYWFKKTSPFHLTVASLLLTLALIPSISFKLKVLVEPDLKGANKRSKESSGEEPDSELDISVLSTWCHKKLAIQERSPAKNSEGRKCRNPRKKVSKPGPKPALQTISQYVNLFGPLVESTDEGIIPWWTVQDGFETDMELLHSIAEWQCCLWAVLLLHQAVEYNGLHLGLYDIFGSNLALHEIHARLSRSEAISEDDHQDLQSYLGYISWFLDASPATRNNFDAMVKFLLQ